MAETKLKEFIQKRGFKINKLSENTGIPQSTLYAKLSGKTDFTRDELIKIKKVTKPTIREINDYFF